MAAELRSACGRGQLTEAQQLWASGGLTLADVRANNNGAFIGACANGHQAVAQWLWALRDGAGAGLAGRRAGVQQSCL